MSLMVAGYTRRGPGLHVVYLFVGTTGGNSNCFEREVCWYSAFKTPKAKEEYLVSPYLVKGI